MDYHRVTADNSQGDVPDSGRVLTFAPNADAIASGQGDRGAVQLRCAGLRVAPDRRGPTGDPTSELRRELCADGPPKPEGIAPGSRKVYYLVTDRGFGERGLRTMRLFGPRNAELK